MMANRIVVDPIARIEGHLRVEAEVKDGKLPKHTVRALRYVESN